MSRSFGLLLTRGVEMNRLSPREEDILALCIEGYTNDAIAHKLGISVGTVNTHWLRIRIKAGGSGRTECVAKIIAERAESALHAANVERAAVEHIIAENHRQSDDLRAAYALLRLAMNQIKSTVWAADQDLRVHIVANSESPSKQFGVQWEPGKTVYDFFQTQDDEHPAVACHRSALAGRHCNCRLAVGSAHVCLRVAPLLDEHDAVMGCIGILNIADECQPSSRRSSAWCIPGTCGPQRPPPLRRRAPTPDKKGALKP